MQNSAGAWKDLNAGRLEGGLAATSAARYAHRWSSDRKEERGMVVRPKESGPVTIQSKAR